MSSACVHRFLNIGIKVSDGVGRGQRSELGLLVKGISYPQALHFCHELALELVGDGTGHDETLGSDAGLPVVLHAGLDGG